MAPDPTDRLRGRMPEDLRRLLRGLLQPRPQQRLSLEAALASPYMARCARWCVENIFGELHRGSVSIQSRGALQPLA